MVGKALQPEQGAVVHSAKTVRKLRGMHGGTQLTISFIFLLGFWFMRYNTTHVQGESSLQLNLSQKSLQNFPGVCFKSYSKSQQVN